MSSKQSIRAERNIPMRMAGILFCLTLISFYLISGMYAKYQASTYSGDSARVITFGDITLKESGGFEDGQEIFIPGVPLTKKAVVSFTGSEAATFVFVEITLKDDWTYTNGTFSDKSSGGAVSWTVADGWTYLPGNGTTHVIYRELEPKTALTDAQMTNLSIQFRAVVVQSGGFKDAGAAWSSVAQSIST